MLAGSHRNAWPDETGTGGRTNRNTHFSPLCTGFKLFTMKSFYFQRVEKALRTGIIVIFVTVPQDVFRGARTSACWGGLCEGPRSDVHILSIVLAFRARQPIHFSRRSEWRDGDWLKKFNGELPVLIWPVCLIFSFSGKKWSQQICWVFSRELI